VCRPSEAHVASSVPSLAIMARLALPILILVACALLLALVATPTTAYISPPLGPVHYAFIQMQYVEIHNIDGVEQAFHADFYMKTTWAVENPDGNWTTDDVITKDFVLNNMWAPQLEFINARDEVTRLVDEPFAFVEEPDFTPTIPDLANPGARLPYDKLPTEIWVTEDQRYQCDFTTPLDMQTFPFDRQFMEFLIESYWEEDQLQIVFGEQDKVTKLLPSNMPDIVGWKWLENGYFAGTQVYEYNGGLYHRLTVRTLLQRQPEYYLMKIIAGSMLLVYMCIFVFALAIDEADRMMGTLQVFAGLVTFLFVASGDVPKVPYQTRLDVFMTFSFICVAVMLVLHAVLYYWRECDVEEFLEEKHEGRYVGHGNDERVEAQKRHSTSSNKISPNPASSGDIELASPSSAGRAYVNAPSVAAEPKGRVAGVNPLDYWYLRKSAGVNFTIKRWWNGLHYTRKWDAMIMPVMMIVYTVGVAIILGRSVPEQHVNYSNP